MRIGRLVLLGMVLVVLALSVDGLRSERSHDPHEVLPPPGPPAGGPPLSGMSAGEVDAFLAELQATVPALEDRLHILALRSLGTPYRRDALGEETPPDADPLFRVDSTDCTVLVLTQAAMAHAGSLAEARGNMHSANYRDAGGVRPIDYGNRLHFTMDRLESSPYYEDITRRVACGFPVEEVTLTLNRKRDGSALLPIPWEKKITAAYVPVEAVTAGLLDRLPGVAGAALVRESQFGLGVVVAHEGIVLDRRDFVHASSEEGRVVKVPFLEYLRPAGEAPRFDGVVFYSFR